MINDVKCCWQVYCDQYSIKSFVQGTHSVSLNLMKCCLSGWCFLFKLIGTCHGETEKEDDLQGHQTLPSLAISLELTSLTLSLFMVLRSRSFFFRRGQTTAFLGETGTNNWDRDLLIWCWWSMVRAVVSTMLEQPCRHMIPCTLIFLLKSLFGTCSLNINYLMMLPTGLKMHLSLYLRSSLASWNSSETERLTGEKHVCLRPIRLRFYNKCMNNFLNYKGMTIRIFCISLTYATGLLHDFHKSWRFTIQHFQLWLKRMMMILTGISRL